MCTKLNIQKSKLCANKPLLKLFMIKTPQTISPFTWQHKHLFRDTNYPFVSIFIHLVCQLYSHINGIIIFLRFRKQIISENILAKHDKT